MMCVSDFNKIKVSKHFLKMCILFDVILLAAAAPLPATSENNLEPLYRLFGSLNLSEVHAIVHHGRAVGELLVHFNRSNPDFYNLTEHEITTCSLLAM